MVGKTRGVTVVEINEHYLETYRLPEDVERARLWDSKLPGFGIVIGKRHVSFVAFRRIKGEANKSNRTLGHWAPSKLRASDAGLRERTLSVSQARGKAIEWLGQMRRGEDPDGAFRRPEPAGGPTLRDAIALHLERMRRKGARPRSIEVLHDESHKHLPHWMDRPLATITRTDCRELHATLSEESGAYQANRVLRHFRAAYNTALKEYELPVCPTIGVHWNKEKRRQEPIPWEKLPGWLEAVKEIKSDVRRDYQLFTLLTGLRKMDAATVRWDHVDWKERTLHRPNPKGGEERAFSIPLSTECMAIFKRRRAGNVEDNGWVFPTDALGARKRKDRECDQCLALGLPPIHAPGARVHLIEPFEPDQRIVSPHRLRDTYTSALAALEPPISGYAIDVLTNHRPPRGTVTAGYIDLSADDLRAAQERVSKFLLAKCTQKKPRRD
jgi:integrase